VDVGDEIGDLVRRDHLAPNGHVRLLRVGRFAKAVVDDLLQLCDGELLPDMAEGGDVRGATPALAVTLGARELCEVVGARGDAGADRGRSAVGDGSDHRHRLRNGLRAAAARDDANKQEAAPDGGSEPWDGPGARHGASIRR
jgi:hypothetical protein